MDGAERLALEIRACQASLVTWVPGFGVSAVAEALAWPASWHEEVACGMAHGASLLGTRSACLLKTHGLLKAANQVSSALSCGTRGAMVLFVFEDREARHSDNVLDAEPLLEALGLPWRRLGDGTVAGAFRWSKRIGLPVALLVNGEEMEAPNQVEETPDTLEPPPALSYPRDPERHLVCPPFAQYQKRVLDARRAGRDPDGIPRPGSPAVRLPEGYGPFFEAFREVRPDFVAGDTTLASLHGLAPWSCVDAVTCLGGSLPMALGALAAGAPRAWAVAGDFSFLSMGPLALLEAWQRDLPLKVAIFDNGRAAATGGQAVPSGALDAALRNWSDRTLRIPWDSRDWPAILGEVDRSPGMRLLVVDSRAS